MPVFLLVMFGRFTTSNCTTFRVSADRRSDAVRTVRRTINLAIPAAVPLPRRSWWFSCFYRTREATRVERLINPKMADVGLEGTAVKVRRRPLFSNL